MLGLLLSGFAEASVPRAGVGALERESAAFASLGAPDDAPPAPVASLRSLTAALAAPAAAEGFSLFAGGELARALYNGGGGTHFTLGSDGLGFEPALASRARELRLDIHLELELLTVEPPRGPPARDPKTRIGGLELFEPFRIEGTERLSLDVHWACGESGCQLAEDHPKDPLGLAGDPPVLKYHPEVAAQMPEGCSLASPQLCVGRVDESVEVRPEKWGLKEAQLWNGGLGALSYTADIAESYAMFGVDVYGAVSLRHAPRSVMRLADAIEATPGAARRGFQLFREMRAGGAVSEGVPSIVPEGGWSFERPPARPTWQQSEQYFTNQLEEFGFKPQVPFKGGQQVAPTVEGSVRPDLTSQHVNLSVEIKNYDVSTPRRRSNVVRRIAKQVAARARELPAGTRQGVILDIRGQKIKPSVLGDLERRISTRTSGAVAPDDIHVEQ